MIVLLLLLFGLTLQAQVATCIRQPASNLFYEESGKKKEAAQFSCICDSGPCPRDRLLQAMWEYGPLTSDTTVRLSQEANSPKFSRKARILIGLQVLGVVIPFASKIDETWIEGLIFSGPTLIREGIDFVSKKPDLFSDPRPPEPWITVFTTPTAVNGFQVSLTPQRAEPPAPEVPRLSTLPTDGVPVMLFDPIRAYQVPWQPTLSSPCPPPRPSSVIADESGCPAWWDDPKFQDSRILPPSPKEKRLIAGLE